MNYSTVRIMQFMSGLHVRCTWHVLLIFPYYDIILQYRYAVTIYNYSSHENDIHWITLWMYIIHYYIFNIICLLYLIIYNMWSANVTHPLVFLKLCLLGPVYNYYACLLQFKLLNTRCLQTSTTLSPYTAFYHLTRCLNLCSTYSTSGRTQPMLSAGTSSLSTILNMAFSEVRVKPYSSINI